MNFLYFDPGLGAMIVQAVVAAAAGILLFSKNAMYKVKAFFGLVKKEDSYDNNTFITIKKGNDDEILTRSLGPSDKRKKTSNIIKTYTPTNSNAKKRKLITNKNINYTFKNDN